MKKKLLLVTDDLPNSGAERQLALLAKYLPKEWDRRVFSLGGGPFVELIRSYGIPVDICKRKVRFDPSPAFVIWRLLAEWRPDVVHSWGWMSSVSAALACKILDIPFIEGTIRMGNKPPRHQSARQLGMLMADRIIANNQAGLSAWGVHPSKGRVVYNGFDPDRLTLCNSLNGEKSPLFTAIMVGRMHPDKDYKSFIDAARILLEKDPDWRFIALGWGELRQSIIKYANDLAENGDVIFPESPLEVLPYVTKAHVGILMSTQGVHEEGISNSIMEYMACGLPVICNNSGGNRELVMEGETGFLIPAGDSHALANRLVYLRDNPREAERLGQGGRCRLITLFTVEAMVQKTAQVYKEVL